MKTKETFIQEHFSDLHFRLIEEGLDIHTYAKEGSAPKFFIHMQIRGWGEGLIAEIKLCYTDL